MKSINAEISNVVKRKQICEKEHALIHMKNKTLKHDGDKIRKRILLSADIICCTLNASGSSLLHNLLQTSRFENA